MTLLGHDYCTHGSAFDRLPILEYISVCFRCWCWDESTYVQATASKVHLALEAGCWYLALD